MSRGFAFNDVVSSAPRMLRTGAMTEKDSIIVPTPRRLSALKWLPSSSRCA
jgi:hypothetical protein